MDTDPDYLILGAGMAGLTVAALLASTGHRVRVLEAHEHPGGCAHSFPMGKWRFCAQVHYIFGCEEGGSVRTFLETVGLEDEVRFNRLDPDGYDRIDIAGDRYSIPNGFEQHRDRLIQRFPTAAVSIGRFCALLMAVRDELDRVPDRPGILDYAAAPFRLPHLLRYRNATLQQVFDAHGLPRRVQAVLAGQAGDYLLPPAEVSFLLHVALVSGYDRGAWYPERHFGHFIDSIVERIRSFPGCSVELGEEVSGIAVEGGRVARVHTTSGHAWSGRTVVSNIDPRRTAAMLDCAAPPAWLRALDYPYSCGSYTLYLGLRGIDLREHGFGSWNLWYYPHEDINRIYADQVGRGDLSDPWLFLSTPTLHTAAPGLAPPGEHVLVAATACSFEHFRALKEAGPAAYTAEKAKVGDRILQVIQERFLPGLQEHLAIKVVGTSTTNARFCWAPEGNAYGAALTPEHVGPSRVPFTTPFPNLYLCNATAGYPSVAGTVRSGQRLVALLEKEAS